VLAVYSRGVRRILLTVAMLLMGMALVGGSAVSLVGTSLVPLDQEVGTHASAAGAVLGIGLMAAAVNPAGNIGWVRAGILYGFVVVAFEAGSYYVWHAPFHFGPIFFGLAFSLLLIATYPQRKKLVPSTPAREKPAAAPAADTAVIAEKEEAAKS
jgi:predicted anti-sigma-YlaC factor YlaD